MYHTFFIHSSVDKHLSCFRVLAVVNSAAVIIGVNASFKLQFSLPSDSPQKPPNTGMGSLCLLQGIFPIFPTLETNWGLLHCRWILDQLSHLGSPGMCLGVGKFNLYSKTKLYSKLFKNSLSFIPKLLLFFLICLPSQLLSSVQLYVTPWTVACQAPLSMGLLRQE